ncbi:MAG: energy-coupling factor ABC transporter ATP-binding protein [Anaerolineae bacterium]
MPTLLVEIEALRHSFSDGWDALNGLSLGIAAGEFVALIGANGSGKTTLAKHLNGLLRPTAGRVVVCGLDTRRVAVGELAHHVGYVFQNPDHQIFSAAVAEELAFGPRAQGVAEAEVQQRVEEELAAFGLTAYAGRPPAILSPGLRRRTAIASVLTARPRVLILDEPTVGLDARERQEMLERVAAYNAAGNVVLLISHDMSIVARWARRCLLLSGGELVADGTPSEVLSGAGLTAAGMRPPVLVQLAQRLADSGMPAGHLGAAAFGQSFLALLRSGR